MIYYEVRNNAGLIIASEESSREAERIKAQNPGSKIVVTKNSFGSFDDIR